ncbi:MAG: hypothetical protein IKJ65_03225, partial [Clostridia bacterium]|nr:hypothetical protein [Clostridia bacterium]
MILSGRFLPSGSRVDVGIDPYGGNETFKGMILSGRFLPSGSRVDVGIDPYGGNETFKVKRTVPLIFSACQQYFAIYHRNRPFEIKLGAVAQQPGEKNR